MHDAPTHTLEPQPRWKVILISLFCLMLIYEKSIDIFQEAKTDSTINVEDEMDKSLAETQEDEEASPLNPDDIFPTLHNLEEVSHSDLFQFQERLEADRGAINMNLFMDTVKKRASWVNGIGVYFKWGVLAVLFLLTLPFFYWRSLANNPNRNQLVFDSLPIYLLTTLATLYLVELLTSAALAAQSVQVIITGFGSPRLAFTDGLLQYLVYQISMHDLQGVWNFLAFNQPQLENDPLATLGALHHLSQGVQQAYESDLLRLGFAVIEQCSWMVNLIGPAFAVATFALIYGSVVPIIQQAIAHPKAVMAGEADRRLWPFIKAIFMNLWRELRATIWVIFLILCISIGAVFAVRVLVYPLVIVFIQSILATETHLRSGGALPDIGIFLTLCTMGLYLVVSMTACFGGAGIAIGKAYLMFRHRAHNKGAFKDYPEFKSVFRTAVFRIAGMAVIAGGLVGIAYWGLSLLSPPPMVLLWAGPILFGPAYLLLVWYSRVPHHFWAAKSQKVIHTPIMPSLNTRKEADTLSDSA